MLEETKREKAVVEKMDLPIGKIIYTLRKKNRVTQEQLAGAVGVSVPAVSKWETGNSYPDITLLMPIARFLGVTVDGLLHYESEIPPEKVLEIEKECARKFEAEGFAAGSHLCQKYLIEYPNNLYLKFRIAYLLPWYAAKCGVEEETAAAAAEKAEELMKEAARSRDGTIRNAALYLLACTEIQMGKAKDARDILEKLPKNECDPNMLLPAVYLQQGELGRATKLWQNNLFQSLQNAVTSLTGLAEIPMKKEDWKAALKLADAQRRLISVFHLEDFMLTGNCGLYLTIYAKMKDTENTLLYLKQYLSLYPYDWSKLHLADNFFFSAASTTEPSVVTNFSKETVIRSLKQNKNFDFLRDDPRFQNLLSVFARARRKAAENGQETNDTAHMT